MLFCAPPRFRFGREAEHLVSHFRLFVQKYETKNCFRELLVIPLRCGTDRFPLRLIVGARHINAGGSRSGSSAPLPSVSSFPWSRAVVEKIGACTGWLAGELVIKQEPINEFHVETEFAQQLPRV